MDFTRRALRKRSSRGRFDYLIVLHHLRDDNCEVRERSDAQQRALDLGARVIAIRRLHEGVAARIDAHSLSFCAATGGPGLLERRRVRGWLKHAYDESV